MHRSLLFNNFEEVPGTIGCLRTSLSHMGCTLSPSSTLPREKQIRIYLEDIAFLTSLKETNIHKVKQHVQYDLKQIIRLSKNYHMEHMYLETKYILDAFCQRYPMLSHELEGIMEESLNTLDISEIYLHERALTSRTVQDIRCSTKSHACKDPLDTVSRVDAFHLRRMNRKTRISPNISQHEERWARRGSADSSRSMKKLIQTMDSHDESMSEGSDYGFYDLSENLSTGE